MAVETQAALISVAPMMDWTDRHCRVFHRRLNPSVRLFTEMVTAKAILFGDQERLLGFSPQEHPLVLQLGGSDPEELAKASQIAADWGYDEVNLNCGCPSDRVQGGAFGAVLMRSPGLVGECLSAMGEGGLPVTLKCRIGVDEQDPEPALDAVADAAVAAGAVFIWVHARKAWLQGLSPAQNRDVPPLDYDRVARLHGRLSPGTGIGLNGGLTDESAIASACSTTDGAMVGRAAYQRPGLLAVLAGHTGDSGFRHRVAVARSMADYAADWMARGGRLANVTRHMLGLFHGEPGARDWRRTLTEEARLPEATPDLILRAADAIEAARERAAGHRTTIANAA